MTRAEKYAAIMALREQGFSWKEVAAQAGMTYSAVRNLYNDPDGSKQKARRERYRRPCPTCGTMMDGSGGMKVQPTHCKTCAPAENRLWTREAVIDAIQRWAAEHGRPPSASQWTRSEDGHPAGGSVYRSTSNTWAPFASWADAIEAAGFPRPKYHRWTPEKIIECIQRFHAEHGRLPYVEEWRIATDNNPTYMTVKHHFGSWNKGMLAAGFTSRRQRRNLAHQPSEISVAA